MFWNLFSSAWALHPGSIDAVKLIISKIINAAYEAGAVDDASREGLPVTKYGSTAVIRTVGPIVKFAGWMARYGVSGTRELQRAFASALNDPDVENILWVLDTPGGSVDGLREAAQYIRSVKEQKPVVAQVDGLLASAGYYLASQASTIYAAEDDLIGSIGVRTVLYDMSAYYESAGVKVIPVDTGKFKSTGVPGAPITDEQVADVQRIVDGYFESFLQMIELGRGLSRKDINALADGRVFFAQDAVSKGLIDGVRTVSETLKALSQNSIARRSARSARAAIAHVINLDA